MGRVRGVWLALAVALLTVLSGCVGQQSQGTSAQATAVVKRDELGALLNLTVDPRDKSLLTATAKGVYRSADNGQTWQSLAIPANLGRSDFSQVVVTPGDPKTVYVGGMNSGVLRSDDNGQTWQSASNGLPTTKVGALALHSTERDTVFAWLKDGGIYRSEDRGANWRFVHEGPSLTDLILLVHSSLEGSMNTGWMYAGVPDGVYLTSDCF